MKTFIKYLLLVSGLFFLFPVFSEEGTGKVPEPEWRIPDKESVESFKGDKSFDYSTPGLRQWPEWMQRLIGKLFEFFGSSIDFIFSNEFGMVLLVIAVAVLIIAIYLRSRNMNLKTLFGRQKLQSEVPAFIAEDVNSMDFDTLIANSLSSGDYRMAIRFLYLRSLKTLSDNDVIRWQAGKTNYSYVHEIENKHIKNKFWDATRIFDFVWYGEVMPDEAKFEEIREFFQQFNTSIGNER